MTRRPALRLHRPLEGLRPLGPAFWGPLRRLAQAGDPPLGQAAGPAAEPSSACRPHASSTRWSTGTRPRYTWPCSRACSAASSRTGRPQTVITGFPFFDRDGEAGLPPDLARFLDDGPPPIVFTLG